MTKYSLCLNFQETEGASDALEVEAHKNHAHPKMREKVRMVASEEEEKRREILPRSWRFVEEREGETRNKPRKKK